MSSFLQFLFEGYSKLIPDPQLVYLQALIVLLQLKLAVEEEMTAYIEQWEDIAEEIEERSAVLQVQIHLKCELFIMSARWTNIV